jgi:glycerol-3-phosphate dehydrogenase
LDLVQIYKFFAKFNLDNRTQMLDRVREHEKIWDFIIIGGGATASDALWTRLRAVRVLLIEQSDFGKGTSSRSTKLIHGGIRISRRAICRWFREA